MNPQETLGKEWIDMGQNRKGIADSLEYGTEPTC